MYKRQVLDRLNIIESTYEKLQQKLIDDMSDVAEMTKTLKEISQIQETVETYRLFKRVQKELDDLIALLQIEKDADLIKMAEVEIVEHEEELKDVYKRQILKMVVNQPD